MSLIVGAPSLASATTWTVNSEDDNVVVSCDVSHCSLREALAEALDGDEIVFAFAGPSAPRTIAIGSALPPVATQVTIDGFNCTNCGTVQENTQLPSAGFDSILGLTLTVSPSYFGSIGELLLVTADEAQIHGLNIQGSPNVGIRIQADDVVVTGCYVGTALDGSATTTSNAGVGIAVEAAEDVVIGPYNIISGNGSHGIDASTEHTDDLVIQGNLVGTDASGLVAVPNGGAGVRLIGDGAGLDDPLVGGATADLVNVISGNAGPGLLIQDNVDGGIVENNLVGVTGAGDSPLPNGGDGVQLLGSSPADLEPAGVAFVGNVISGNGAAGVGAEAAKDCSFTGNWIGTDASGLLDLGNTAEGIYLYASTIRDTKQHWIGGATAVDANTIAFNGGDGIRMRVAGSKKVKENRIGINAIHDNGGIGIDLEADAIGDGPAEPDTTCGSDNAWGNRKVARPVVTDALLQGGFLTVTGTGCDEAEIDVYLADGDASGYGEPMLWLGSTVAVAGDWTATVAVTGLFDGDLITVLQTDGDDETSEAAANVALFACDADEDGYDVIDALCAGGDDCDDTDPSIYPTATESCDLVDSDCDGSLVDEFVDTDGDLDPDCTDPDNDDDGDLDGTDCEPLDDSIYTDAPELCDAIDSDCDGSLVDEFVDTDGDLDPDCIDLDDDEDGDPDLTDCEPLDPAFFTGAPEFCDAIDQDCDGSLVDEFVDTDANGDPDCTDPDNDGDGDLDGADCAPEDPTIYNAAPELCDAVDSDCDGSLVDEFVDTDADLDPDCTDPDDDQDADPDITDCAPLDAAIHAAAVEVCDAVDQDCDGVIDDGFDVDGDGVTSCGPNGVPGNADDDCDDGDPAIFPGQTEACDLVDNDCDGFIDEVADLDGDGFNNCEGDCDDTDPAISPAAAEACDGLDTDCDGVLPADEADADSDTVMACAGDCDDSAGTVFPGATELCDGLDGDCDGALPADELDGDGDGALACADCDDAVAAVFPGATELCDGLDNDCDGVVPADETDDDGDGHSECRDGDCDDTQADTYIGAIELCGDGRDNDCDGVDWDGIDDDGDGFGECEGDCDDTDETIGPDAQEICEDEVDQDCDGSDQVDYDEDGWLDELCGGEDCDDADEDVHPGVVDECFDGVDNDCDGVEADDVDEDGDTWSPCDDDCDDLDAAVHPEAEELCNDLDDDCDGLVDEGLPEDCDDECAEPDADGDGWLDPVCGGLDCDDSNAEVNPDQVEICGDAVDQDCDGIIAPCTPVLLGEAPEEGCTAQVGGRRGAGLVALLLVVLLAPALRRRPGSLRTAPLALTLLLVLPACAPEDPDLLRAWWGSFDDGGAATDFEAGPSFPVGGLIQLLPEAATGGRDLAQVVLAGADVPASCSIYAGFLAEVASIQATVDEAVVEDPGSAGSYAGWICQEVRGAAIESFGAEGSWRAVHALLDISPGAGPTDDRFVPAVGGLEPVEPAGALSLVEPGTFVTRAWQAGRLGDGMLSGESDGGWDEQSCEDRALALLQDDPGPLLPDRRGVALAASANRYYHRWTFEPSVEQPDGSTLPVGVRLPEFRSAGSGGGNVELTVFGQLSGAPEDFDYDQVLFSSEGREIPLEPCQDLDAALDLLWPELAPEETS